MFDTRGQVNAIKDIEKLLNRAWGLADQLDPELNITLVSNLFYAADSATKLRGTLVRRLRAESA